MDHKPEKQPARPSRTCVYLSASIGNGPLNLKIREALDPAGFELVLPQEFAPRGLDHPLYPLEIYENCVAEMERCRAGLLLLDAFGMDSASEAGWFAARGKPLIGLAAANLRFLRHWMVKGSLTGVVCLDACVFEGVRSDPILGSLPVKACASLKELAPALAELIDSGESLIRSRLKGDRR